MRRIYFVILRFLCSMRDIYEAEGLKAALDKIATSSNIKRENLFQGAKLYISFGVKELKTRLKGRKDKLSVLIISRCPGETFRYRAVHKKEQLNLFGIDCQVASFIPKLKPYHLDFYDIFIFHRTPWDIYIEKLIKQIHCLKKIAIFDVDDLLFEQSCAYGIKRSLSDVPRTRDFYVSSISRFLKTMEETDCSFVSTDFLAGLIKQRNKKAFTIKNALSGKLIDLSGRALSNKNNKAKGKVVLGYLSGTNTHRYDFQQIEDVLINILEKYDNVNLCIGGYLSLDKVFDRFSARIKRIPFVSWRRLPSIITRLDINLVPLEADNPFSQAKSEIKYIEAGICRVPTVASRVGAYEGTIKNGINGFLPSTDSEWTQTLKMLIEDEKLRFKIGQNAREDVMERYHPYKMADELVKTLKEISYKNTVI